MSEKYHIDLDAILAETALVITVNAKTYTIDDVPLALTIRFEEAAAEGKEIADRDIVFTTLRAAGAQEADLDPELFGSRKIKCLSLKIMDFFSATDLIERLNVNPMILNAYRAYQTGSMLPVALPTSSLPTE